MRVSGKIYLDYQASTPVDSDVLSGMLSYFTHDFGNPHSSEHALGWSAAAAIDRARSSVASLIGANAEELFFTSGATESINHVIHAVCRSRPLDRTKILVSAIEHSCVLRAAEAYAECFGLTVELIPVRSSGLVDIERYRSMLDSSVALVAVMAVNNEIGTVQPIPKLSELAHFHGAYFFSDAVQAPLALKVDVEAWGVDFLSLSAHKLYGPKGVGALFMRSGLSAELFPLMHGGGQQEGVRPGTLPTPLCVGFGLAAESVISRYSEDYNQLLYKKDYFIASLKNHRVAFSLNGIQGELCHPGNISVNFHGVDAHSLLTKLQPLLCAATGSACSSGFIEQSHVLRSIGLDEASAASTLRVSIGRYTDLLQLEESAAYFSAAIKELLS